MAGVSYTVQVSSGDGEGTLDTRQSSRPGPFTPQGVTTEQYPLLRKLLAFGSGKPCFSFPKPAPNTDAHLLSRTPAPSFIAQDGCGYLGPDHQHERHPKSGVHANDPGNSLEKQLSVPIPRDPNSTAFWGGARSFKRLHVQLWSGFSWTRI